MIKQFKEDIKKLAEEQKSLKNQRKTVHLVGERKVNPYDAANQIRRNKYLLTHMYHTYNLIRGKESNYNDYPIDNYQVDKLLKKYKVEEVV